MLDSISKWEVYLGLAINGIATGLGAAIGTYFANNHIIKKSEKLVKRIRRRLK